MASLRVLVGASMGYRARRRHGRRRANTDGAKTAIFPFYGVFSFCLYLYPFPAKMRYTANIRRSAPSPISAPSFHAMGKRSACHGPPVRICAEKRPPSPSWETERRRGHGTPQFNKKIYLGSYRENLCQFDRGFPARLWNYLLITITFPRRVTFHASPSHALMSGTYSAVLALRW